MRLMKPAWIVSVLLGDIAFLIAYVLMNIVRLKWKAASVVVSQLAGKISAFALRICEFVPLKPVRIVS